MGASPRNTVKQLHQKLQEQPSELFPLLPKEREILEHLVFAVFLENTPVQKATAAFELLEDYFIDWNEIRVSSTSELAELLAMLPFPQRTVDRARRTLQWIFDTTYKFDLEEWRKKDAKEFSAFLYSNPYTTRFVHDYVLHFVMNQSVLPFDEGAMRVMRVLDLVEVNSENREQVRGMDRTFSRQDADLFFLALHQFGTEMMRESILKKHWKFLKSVDPKSEARSYLPLVEIEEEKDPSQIAKAVVAKQHKRSKPSMILDLNDADLEDTEVDFVVESDENEINEEKVTFGMLADDEAFEKAEPPVKEKKQRKDSTEAKKGTVQEPSGEKNVKVKPESAPVKKPKEKKEPAKPVKVKKNAEPKKAAAKKSERKQVRTDKKPVDKKVPEKKPEKKTVSVEKKSAKKEAATKKAEKKSSVKADFVKAKPKGAKKSADVKKKGPQKPKKDKPIKKR